jgi:hypothetical protein
MPPFLCFHCFTKGLLYPLMQRLSVAILSRISLSITVKIHLDTDLDIHSLLRYLATISFCFRACP